MPRPFEVYFEPFVFEIRTKDFKTIDIMQDFFETDAPVARGVCTITRSQSPDDGPSIYINKAIEKRDNVQSHIAATPTTDPTRGLFLEVESDEGPIHQLRHFLYCRSMIACYVASDKKLSPFLSNNQKK